MENLRIGFADVWRTELVRLGCFQSFLDPSIIELLQFFLRMNIDVFGSERQGPAMFVSYQFAFRPTNVI